MTGNPKLDSILFIVGYALFIVSEALGKSKRFQANGTVQFICQFIAAGWRGVKAPSSGLLEHAIEIAGPIVEKQIEGALNTQEVAAQPDPPAQDPAHNLTNLS